MARIVPADLTRLAMSGVHEPEMETLTLLKEALPDDYTVFHGVHWSRQYKGHTIYGEIDFVVLNQAGQVLCIEQKNGPLLEAQGKLFKEYSSAQKDVAEQILRAVGNVKEKFGRQYGRNPLLEVEYLIYCPDHAVRNVDAAAIDRERVIDAPRRDRLASTIQSILPAEASDLGGRAERVHAFFRRRFEVVPDVHAHVSAQERNFTRLSGGLVEVLDCIEMDPLRLHVSASAGSGKTLVAAHFCERMPEAGLRPLLLCFNCPLAERLKHLAPAPGAAYTWYGLCDRFLQSRGIHLDFTRKNEPGFWTEAVQQTADEALRRPPSGDWLYDALVVDEAQDFEEGWLEILRLFLADKAPMLWLEDPYQNVRGIDPAPLRELGFVGYRSLLNYRSPERIAQFIACVLPEFEFICANDLPGLGVGVTSYEDAAEQSKIVGKLVGRLLHDRFAANQIAILSCRGLDRSALQDIDRVGNHTLSRYTGDYDLFGNQLCTKGQVLFDTVRRFKGQQDAAIILTDVDPDPDHLKQALSVLFCGMTRATVRLELVCNAGNPWVAERILPVANT